MTIKPPSRTADQFVLRLPDGMRDHIADLAKKSNRSMNAEIVARLEESFANTGNPNMVATVARLTMALALANAEKLNEQMRVSVLATYVRQFAELLLPHLDTLDRKTISQVNEGVGEANAYIHSIPALRKQAGENSAAIRNALNHLRSLAGMETPGDELDRMLRAIEQTGGQDAASQTPKPAGGLDLDAIEQAGDSAEPEAPKTRKRIVRSASKKTTEK